MTEHLTTDPGYRLEYIVSDDAWYAEANRHVNTDPYLNIAKVADGGGCAWEFQIVDKSRTIGQPATRVEVFDDAFAAFAEVTPLFAAIADEHPAALDEVREILDRFGFADATTRVNPTAADQAARLREEAARLLAEADKLTPKD